VLPAAVSFTLPRHTVFCLRSIVFISLHLKTKQHNNNNIRYDKNDKQIKAMMLFFCFTNARRDLAVI